MQSLHNILSQSLPGIFDFFDPPGGIRQRFPDIFRFQVGFRISFLEYPDATSPMIVPTVTRNPRMQGLPPITVGVNVMRPSCFINMMFPLFQCALVPQSPQLSGEADSHRYTIVLPSGSTRHFLRRVIMAAFTIGEERDFCQLFLLRKHCKKPDVWKSEAGTYFFLIFHLTTHTRHNSKTKVK